MKIIHCADLHLDSPMETHMTREKASMRNAEILRTFMRMTEYAKKENVRAILIAGDLFDGERVTSRTVDEVLNMMRETSEIDYLYLPGNHDGLSFAFSDKEQPGNLKQFSRQWMSVLYDEAAVSGIEITKDNAISMYEKVPHIENKVNIIALHGQTGTSCGENLVNLNFLKGKGIDYLALGHIHTYAQGELDEKGVYCYAGCLEGRGFDECGEKGFVLLDIEGGRVHSRFVPFSARRLHRIPVDITGLTTNSEIYRAMKEASGKIPQEDMVEYILTGHSEPESRMSLTHLQSFVREDFFFSKIKDESRLAVSAEAYKNDVSLKGEFIRLVMQSEADEEDKARIIRAGLEALAGEEIEI